MRKLFFTEKMKALSFLKFISATSLWNPQLLFLLSYEGILILLWSDATCNGFQLSCQQIICEETQWLDFDDYLCVDTFFFSIFRIAKRYLVCFVVQSLNHVRLFATLWTAARQASLSFTLSRSLLKLVSIESGMPSNHLILNRPLLLLSSVFPSIRVFSNELALCFRWPK